MSSRHNNVQATSGVQNVNSAQAASAAGKRKIARRSFQATGLGLACLLFAAMPALGAAAPTYNVAAQSQTPATAPAKTPATQLAMNAPSTPAALTVAMPPAEKCPEAAAQPLPSTASDPAAKMSPCVGTLTSKLLEMAARKAGKYLPVPVLVL